MFRGLTAISIDSKGRIAIPSRYRDRIQSEADGVLVITIDTEERCLLLYPQPQWEQIERKIESLPSYHRVSRRIQRLLIGHASEIELDRHGRILVPPLLREYAGLEQMVMLVGQGKKFELWGVAQWESAREDWLAEELPKEEELPTELTTISL